MPCVLTPTVYKNDYYIRCQRRDKKMLIAFRTPEKFQFNISVNRTFFMYVEKLI